MRNKEDVFDGTQIKRRKESGGEHGRDIVCLDFVNVNEYFQIMTFQIVYYIKLLHNGLYLMFLYMICVPANKTSHLRPKI